ncbi:MAG: hypothetical protein ACTIAR_05375, partial [Brachybacterium tyrofermentans]
TNTRGWERLDAHETSLGEHAGRPRIKLVERDEMVEFSRDSPVLEGELTGAGRPEGARMIG